MRRGRTLLLLPRVVSWVVVQKVVDVARRCGEAFMRTPRETNIHGFWVHVNDFAYGLSDCVMLTMFGRKTEIVNVDDQHRAGRLMPIDALPFFGQALKTYRQEFLFAVRFPEAACVGVAVEGQYQFNDWPVEVAFPVCRLSVLR